MTTWIGQRQSELSAGIPGIEATPGRIGWLGVKSWLRQQLAKVISAERPEPTAIMHLPIDALKKASRYQTRIGRDRRPG
jgi:hypothetical protein